MYNGLLIKESLADENLLDYVKINKVELWKTPNTPKYWTAISFESDVEDFPYKLAKALKNDSPWYVDFKVDNVKYIVLKDNVLTYIIGDIKAKKSVMNRCLELGIPERQLDWSE